MKFDENLKFLKIAAESLFVQNDEKVNKVGAKSAV